MTKQELAVQPETLGLINPDQQIEFGRQCATALVKIINSKPKKVVINGEQYLEFEDWQTIARFFNTTVGTESTTKVEENGQFRGYSAVAVVYNQAGVKIGSAEASCFKEERNWGNKPEFQLKSMAQTRACAKALRNIFGWVVVLAGYKTTPSEELDAQQEPFKDNQLNKSGRVSKITPAQIKKIQDQLKELGRKYEELGYPKKLEELGIKKASETIVALQKRIDGVNDLRKPETPPVQPQDAKDEVYGVSPEDIASLDAKKPEFKPKGKPGPLAKARAKEEGKKI